MSSGHPDLALLFAVPHEAGALDAALSDRSCSVIEGMRIWHGRRGALRVVFGCVGMGAVRAEKGASLICQQFSPSKVMMCGYAGGLDPSLPLGAVVAAPSLADWISPHPVGSAVMGRCLTVNRVLESPDAKQRARDEAGLPAPLVCEMEWEGIQKACAAYATPCGWMRAVSDPFGLHLPSGALDSSWDPECSAPTPLRLISYLAAHPTSLLPFMRFVGGLGTARRQLRSALLKYMDALASLL